MRRRLAVYRALEASGRSFADGSFEDLVYLLAPLLARNPREQREFYLIFQKFCEENKKEADNKNSPTIDKSLAAPLPPQEPTWKAFLQRLLWVAALVGSAYLAFKLINRPKTPTGRLSFEKNTQPIVREGDRPLWLNTSEGVDSNLYEWELRRQNSTGEALATARTVHFEAWTAAGVGQQYCLVLKAQGYTRDTLAFTVRCADPPPVPRIEGKVENLQTNARYTFRSNPPPEVEVLWVINGRDSLRGASASYSFSQVGSSSVQCVFLKKSPSTPNASAKGNPEKDTANRDAPALQALPPCFSDTVLTVSIGRDKPIMAIFGMQEDSPRLYRQINWIGWLLLLSPFLATLFNVFLWWRDRQRKAEALRQKTENGGADSDTTLSDFEYYDKAPYNIPYRPLDGLILVPPDFFRMADVLRRREENERSSFDADASVRATVEGGGFPAFREKADTTPTNHLFLVERKHGLHQESRLLERLVHFFKKQDAHLEVWFFDGKLQTVWNETQPEGISIAQLHRLFPQYRLVILGNAHGLVNPYQTREPALYQDVLRHLLAWNRRLILTTSPVSAWSVQEVLLQKHFLLFPIDTRGIFEGLDLLDRMEEFDPEPYRSWEAAQAKGRSDLNDRYRTWDTIEDHRDYLANDPEAFRWLCGLAVCVQPDWALTLAIGQSLGVSIEHDRLLRLCRIPWLTNNEPDQSLRLQFIGLLSQEDERAARAAVAAELEAVEEQTKGGFAEVERKTNLALQHFVLDPEDEAHKETLRRLKAAGLLSGMELDELDYVVQERMTRRSDLPSAAYTNLGTFLDAPPTHRPEPIPRKLLLALGYAVWGCIFLFAGNRFNAWEAKQAINIGRTPPLVRFWQKPLYYGDAAMELHNRAVGIARRMSDEPAYERWSDIANDSIGHVDSLLEVALRLRAYPEAERSRYLARYNFAAKRLNYYLMDSIYWNPEAVNLSNSGMESNIGQSNRLPVQQFSNALPPDFRSALVLALDRAEEGFEAALKVEKRDLPSRLDALHGIGLCRYFRHKEMNDPAQLDSAKVAYDQILSASKGQFFDTIRAAMPVNLETLLQTEDTGPAPLYGFSVLVLDAATGAPIRDAALLPAGFPPMSSRVDGSSVYVLGENAPPTPKTAASLTAKDYKDLRASLTTWRGTALPAAPDSKRKGGSTNPSINVRFLGTDTLRMERRIPKGTAAVTASTPPPTTDLCPDDPNKTAPGLCGCGTPDTDTDGDGTPDCTDACPSDKTKTAPGLCGCGTPDTDTDGDGIPDCTDKCPDVAAKTPDGCPTPSNTDPFEMVFVKGGNFRMGCTKEQSKDCLDREKPDHNVQVPDFYIGKYEVTQAQWREIMSSDPEKLYNKGCDDCPVENVSWNDVQDFLKKLNARTGKNYRLPSESEWEYAARGGSQSRNYLYSGGNNADEVAWHDGNYKTGKPNGEKGTTHPVGTRKPNELYIYDMSGNVYEWCQDWYHDSYEKAPDDGSAWIYPVGSYRVLRGGSWNFDPSNARVAYRYNVAPGYRSSGAGFRLARTP